MKEYNCYFGNAEQYKHTLFAPSFQALRKIIEEKFNLHNIRWYKQPVIGNYPSNSKRFRLKKRAIKGVFKYEHNTPLLIIEQ